MREIQLFPRNHGAEVRELGSNAPMDSAVIRDRDVLRPGDEEFWSGAPRRGLA